MTAGTKRAIRVPRRLPDPAILLTFLVACVVLYAGVAVFMSWRRVSDFTTEVEHLSGEVRVSQPRWSLNPHLSRFAPLFKRVDGVWVFDADVDDQFVTRAGAAGDLEYLHVRGPGITDQGVESLRGEQELRDVSLWETSITDHALASLAQLPELNALHATTGEATFSDVAFESLAQAPKLTRLTIGPAALSEQGAANLKLQPTLEHLRIDGGHVDAAAFVHLGRITGLRTLWLDAEIEPPSNPLPQLRLLTQLEALCLHATSIDDLAARDLCRFGHLRKLDLSGTTVGDETVRRLAETEYPRGRIQTLDFNGTGVTDSCLDHLFQFPRLRRLRVRNTEFSEASAADLCRRRRQVLVEYSGSDGSDLEMTWLRVHQETDGTMRWQDGHQ